MIDIEKFICSLLADHPEGVTVRGDIHRALKEQGLEYKDGKIVPIEDKESEDEKIRKEIITYLSTVDDKELIPYESWIAWLERNVEQKPLEEGTFVNVDEVREDFMQEVYRVLDADPTNDRANQIIDAFDSLPTLEFEKHSEQKPDNVETKFKVKYAGSEYSVQEVKDIAGITFYGIEDELNHIDYIKADSCEIINGGYGIKENGCSFPTKSIIFSE